MRLETTQRQQIAISYGILAVLLLAAAFSVLRSPLVERFQFAAKLGELRDVYGRSVGAIARSAAAREALDARQAQNDVGAQLFQAETAALAGAQLQNDLRALIESERGVLVSSAFRQTSDSSALTPVSVSVRMRSSVAGLVRILAGLEHRSPALFVENLVVQSRHRPGETVTVEADELEVEFDVTGYLDGAP